MSKKWLNVKKHTHTKFDMKQHKVNQKIELDIVRWNSPHRLCHDFRKKKGEDIYFLTSKIYRVIINH